MSFITALLTLLMPFAVPGNDSADDDVARQARVQERTVPEGPMSRRAPDWTAFVDGAAVPVANQVRIEGRVIVRISPQPSAVRNELLADLPRQAVPPRLVERPFGRCIAANGIVGVSDRGSRLIIYMRDRSMISAKLEKACSPRDFYLGFYMERNEDGQLCSGRDRLMSRAGAKCQISEMNRLVLVSDDG
ncbi:hypothetical protein [Erythrobacter mangrovi]|uniref:Uncharacterized protein n=1 Tax=Erythrobacter mangrovi TaxID=2739433 RepID=A0A7D4C564_9SPHN|nr:hypothetical protein [Erythrobacter mangrovi]QKG71845.1 hypothetical protein HQR01_11015 [Erythrobacter mangrovi]